MLKSSLLAALLFASSLIHGDHTFPHYRRLSVRHIEAGGIGYKKGYTTLEGFASTDPGNWRCVPFLDARAHVFDDGKIAANGGIGARTTWGCRAYGANAYYDYRNSHRRNFNQASMGLETLGDLWDVRVNGYLPFGNKRSRPYDPTFGGFTGHSMLIDRKFQYAMKGVDGEVGFHFGWSALDFYGAGGAYYFKGEVGDGAVGGKARLAASYQDYVTLEVSDSYDTVFHNHVQGQLTLSLPFGPRASPRKMNESCPQTPSFKASIAKRMVQPVARQEIVVLNTHTKTEPDPQFFVFVNNQSNSLGTFESPYPTLALAQTNSSAGDVIYVFPGNGMTTGMNTGITLKRGQKLWGSGTSQTLATARFGNITIPNLTSTSPQITTNEGNAITLAEGVEVSGVVVTRSPGNGISGTLLNSVTLLNTTVFASTDAGISLTASSAVSGTWKLQGLNVVNSGANGISLSSTGGATVEITGCYVNASGTSGILVDSGEFPAPITILNNTSSNNGNLGISVSCSPSGTRVGTINVSSNQVSGNSRDDGIRLTWGATSTAASTATISKNIVDSNVVGGIGFALTPSGTGTLNLTVDSNTVAYSRTTGMTITANASGGAYQFPMSFSNNYIHNNTTSGMTFSTIGTSVVRLSLLNNTLDKNVPSSAAFTAADEVGATGSTCLYMVGNTSDTGYSITRAGDTSFSLAPGGAAGIRALNSGTVTTSGTITSTSNCNP